MKRVLSLVVLIMMFTTTVCSAAGWVYPEHSGANTPVKNERINIVFDNSGHDYVKSMLIEVLIAASVAENADIWIYPIAGSNEPIKVEPTKEFVEANFNKYTKSSNEFKAEDMSQKAFDDLVADTSVEKKRYIKYLDTGTKNSRSEYDIDDFSEVDASIYPDIKLTSFNASGTIMTYVYNDTLRGNYDSVQGVKLHEFVLIRNGYSQCEVNYDKESGIITIDKNKANNNIFVLAVNYPYYSVFSDYGEYTAYLSGCLMDSDTYKDYTSKSKVKGVALSYNHIVADHYEDENSSFAAALFTLDGTTINPQEEAIYIPVKNACDVKVYHRETKGSGICSAETSYKVSQDKKIVNEYAPEDETNDVSSMLGSDESVLNKVFSIIGLILRSILTIAFALLRFGILAFIIICIVSRKFRSYVQLKILSTKFGPTYQKILIKIKKIFKDILNSGKKIKGNTDLNCKYIFISKSSADMIIPNNRIELLICELEKRGIKCWLSEKGIKPGQNYNLILPEAIRRCALFLLFLSPISVKSSEVVSEVSTAKEYQKNIIPVQIEPFELFETFTDWAYMLKQYQKADLFQSKPEEISALADYIEQTFNEID